MADGMAAAPTILEGPARVRGVLDAELREYVGPRREALVAEGRLPGECLLDPSHLDSRRASELGLAGLALSGGGIRAATFHLGLVQLLAKKGVLERCDYLSTVSGGGYLGGCLISLLSSGHAGVSPSNFPFRSEGMEEREEVRRLRRAGNYLIPRRGLLRLDTWKLVSAYLGGLTLRLTAVVGLLALLSAVGILVYPWLLRWIGHLQPGDDLWGDWKGHLRKFFAPSLLVLVFWLISALGYLLTAVEGTVLRPGRLPSGAVARVGGILFPLLAGVLLGRDLDPALGPWLGVAAALTASLGSFAASLEDRPVGEGRILGRPAGRWLMLLAGAAFFVLVPAVALRMEEPTRRVLALWIGGVCGYAAGSVGGWTIEDRRVYSARHSNLLRLAFFLAVLGALPVAIGLAEPSIQGGNGLGKTFLGLLGICAVSLLRPRLLGTPAARWPGRIRRGLVLGGAWGFLALLCAGVFYAVRAHRNWAPSILGVSLVFLVLFVLLTEINRVSMFHFYRDRLSEAFLFTRRSPEDDTPLEPNDDLALSAAVSPATGAPYPLFNATANLPGSTDRDLRDRRADFFLFSPLYCGSPITAYRRTREYESNRTMLAGAMTLSGAALNPQFGAATHPALAFLMALLNVRLGAWATNPRYEPRRTWLRRRKWPFYLFQELFSGTDEWSTLLNLSDGGHIENLGVYELLRRRCAVIVASDASADPDRSFGDLGNLIRKARIYLGVRIEIDVDPLRPDPETGISRSHFVVGRILYPRDGGPAHSGVLIYVKSTVVAGDPVDLHEYRRRHEAFPHEPTADQFFDEAQFESYRELGYLSWPEEAAAAWAAAFGSKPVR